MDKTANWLATYLERYSSIPDPGETVYYMVAYRTRNKPSRMFYYKLEQLLTAVGGKRIQKSVILVPHRALTLIRELCSDYDAEVFEAPFGASTGSD